MRIGIDATTWTNWRGFGRFTRSLVDALLRIDAHNEYALFFDSSYHQCRDLPPGARHVVARTSRPQLEALTVTDRRSLRDLWRMWQAVAREPLDLFFFPSIDSYFPMPKRLRTIVTVHDTIPERYPRLMLPGAGARLRRRLKVAVALRRAARVATGSEYTRREISHVFGLPLEHIDIIPYGAAAVFRPPSSREAAQREVRARYGIGAPYLLHVGGFGLNKNLPALIEAFARVTQTSPADRPSLVFVGRRDDDTIYPESRQLDELIDKHNLTTQIRFLGFQADESLVVLYQGAAALLSLKEGYGLPGIEAVACGTPVVATRESPLPELLGDAALVIDPGNPADLRRALETVLWDSPTRKHLCRAAIARADQFSWTRSAEAALALFSREASGPARSVSARRAPAGS